jgi:hypothetical protein
MSVYKSSSSHSSDYEEFYLLGYNSVYCDVSEEHVTSIFRVKARNQREVGTKHSLVDFQRTTQHYMPEDQTLNFHILPSKSRPSKWFPSVNFPTTNLYTCATWPLISSSLYKITHKEELRMAFCRSAIDVFNQ